MKKAKKKGSRRFVGKAEGSARRRSQTKRGSPPENVGGPARKTGVNSKSRRRATQWGPMVAPGWRVTDAMCWNRALTAAEVKAIHRPGPGLTYRELTTKPRRGAKGRPVVWKGRVLLNTATVTDNSGKGLTWVWSGVKGK